MLIAVGFLLLAVITLVAGTSGDLFGRKLILVSALVLQTLANLFGGLTLGTPQFIVTDIIGSITAVAIIPMCISIVTLTYPMETRPLAFGLLFGLSSVATITGASVGGLFEMWGIPSAAFIPVIIVGILTIRLVARNVPESRAQKGFRRTSAVVNLLLLVSIFILIYLFLAGQKLLESWLPVLLAACAVLALIAGVRWLRKRVSFFHGVEMFTGADTGFSMLAGLVLFIAQGTILYQFTAFFQKIQHMSVVKAGVAFAPYVIGMLMGTALIPWLAGRFGARRIIVAGLVIMSTGLVWLSFIWVETPYWFLLVPLLITGIGFGIANPVRTQVVLSAPPIELTGSAAAVNTAVGQSGYGLGVVISSIIITALANNAFVAPFAQAGVSEATLNQIKLALPSVLNQTASGEYPNIPQAVIDMAHVRYDQVLTASMGQMLLVTAITMFLAAVIIYIGMRRKLRLGKPSSSKLNDPLDEEATPVELDPRGESSCKRLHTKQKAYHKDRLEFLYMGNER